MTARERQRAAHSVVERTIIAMLHNDQPVRYKALGGSMWPVVRPRAVLEILPCSAVDLNLGDLGAYEGSLGEVVVHRVVVALRNGVVIFRGDALAQDDAPVDARRVLGRARVVSQPSMRVRLPTRSEVTNWMRLGIRLGRLWLSR